MNILKTFAMVRSGSGKVFLEKDVPKMSKILKYYKSERNPLKILKGVLFLVKLQVLNLQL